MKNVCILVAGSWGTALAAVLADNQINVKIWSRSMEQVIDINDNHENKRFLPGVKLSTYIRATTVMEEAIASADAVIFAAPSSAMREVAKQANHFLEKDALIIHATKGFEIQSLKR